MSKTPRIIVYILSSLAILLLLLTLILSPAWAARPEDVRVAAPTAIPTAVPTPAPTPDATATPVPTATPTPEPTATPTPEPTPILYDLTFVGDCTLASYPQISAWAQSFENVVNGDWAYPFSGTRELFEDDDLTVVNLECCFTDREVWSGSTFSFKAPVAAVEILSGSGVEFATTANNHAMDFGEDVYRETVSTLEGAGIVSCGDGESALYTTENGLVVGIYAVHSGHWPDANATADAVKALKADGAEIVVVCAHWGNEGSYYQNSNEEEVAHAAIDAGASIVIGHGPHRLQPAEEYNGGIIFYSLGNFVFGGNTAPEDMDSAIARVTIVRQLDGTISLHEWQAFPCSISSERDVNTYCPTLFDSGSEEYERALSKVLGTWNGANSSIDYSFMHPEG